MDAAGSLHFEPWRLSFLERAAVWLTWGVAGALFLTVGWMAMAPVDPLGPVCVLTSRAGVTMLLQAGVLAAVCAWVCTLIAGRSVVDAGTFAAAVGLAAVSLRGGTAEYLLLYGDGSVSGALPVDVVAVRFAAASVGWFVVMMLAAGVSMLVSRWCFGGAAGGTDQDASSDRGFGFVLAAADIPTTNLTAGTVRAPATPLSDGLLHFGVATGVGLLAFFVLTAPASTRAIQHGQSCFFVMAAVWLACYFAHRIAPVRSAFWSVLAVFLMAVAGYGWSALRSQSGTAPPSIPESPFMRVLPIQFIAVGTATAISALWSVQASIAHRGFVTTDDSQLGG